MLFFYFHKDLIAGGQTDDEIGPNFNTGHFFVRLNHVAITAWQRRCKKVSGHDYAYAIAMYSREEFVPCIENWEKSENFEGSQNFKSLINEYVMHI